MALNADPDRFVLSLGPPPSQSDRPRRDPPPGDDSRTRAFTYNLSHFNSSFNLNLSLLFVVLIFGHLFVNLVAGEGVKAIDFGFVGGKLSQPFWQSWDTLLLWLAARATAGYGRFMATLPKLLSWWQNASWG